jgi:catechol 2,3-dioxygenase-like lactoylglutathione lyase family enzyme
LIFGLLAPLYNGMLHHLSFSVSDLDKASSFYDAVLSPLGYVRVWTFPDAVGYGVNGGDDQFAIKARTKQVAAPSPGFHVAFSAKDRQAVDAFYAAAMAQGAKDNGAPGMRPHYGPHYYAAFVTDLDGYPIEAVVIAP